MTFKPVFCSLPIPLPGVGAGAGWLRKHAAGGGTQLRWQAQPGGEMPIWYRDQVVRAELHSRDSWPVRGCS